VFPIEMRVPELHYPEMSAVRSGSDHPADLTQRGLRKD